MREHESGELCAPIARKPGIAVAYLRVSTRTNEDGDGFRRQLEACERYCRTQRLTLCGKFSDVVSGATEDRVGLSRLLSFIDESGVGTVVVERGDRLARDVLVHALIVRKLTERGVRVVTSEGHDLAADDSPTSKFVAQVLSALAELDKNLTVARLRAARDAKREKEGRCEGPPPYGADAHERRVIARIRELRRKARGKARRSFATIAMVLDTEGLPPRNAERWAPSSVRKIAMRIGVA